MFKNVIIYGAGATQRMQEFIPVAQAFGLANIMDETTFFDTQTKCLSGNLIVSDSLLDELAGIEHFGLVLSVDEAQARVNAHSKDQA